MKKLVTALLTAFFLFCSCPRAAAPQRESTTVVECGVAIIVIGIGAVCIYGIWKCCKVLDKLDPQNPPSPPTNNIPTNSIPTNTLPPLRISSYSTNLTVQSCDLTAQSWKNRLHLALTDLGTTMILTGDNGLCLTSTVVNGAAVFYLPPVTDSPAPSRCFRLLSSP